ncbi:MAG TPA: hypothetical protein VK849_07485, partial [Longimicrobiales bacterium]|nr:hypothetical protein [Longimicrobiales bacterium]
MSVDPHEIARLLRQRSEMGASSLFLGGLSREEALALAAELSRSGREGPASPPPGRPDAGRPRKSGPGPG